LTDAQMVALTRLPWPGNVRELRNHLERLVIVGESFASPARRSAEDSIEATARSGVPFRQARALVLERFTDIYVESMLAQHDGNVSRAAKAAGVGRRYFQRLKQDAG
jgi:DNA-binding NtrC family response regulator